MSTAYADILRRLSRPLDPRPTSAAARLASFDGVRAVLFDLYGTLFVSGTGEVGTARQATRRSAMVEALQAVGLATSGIEPAQGQVLFDVIEEFHAEGRSRGIAYPEVQIVEVWRRVLQVLREQGAVCAGEADSVDLGRLAVEYEARANPVWPMPGAADCLRALRERGVLLGIVSNAQFYTAELFPALLDARPEELGFDPALVFYSYRHGLAKPGPELYRMAARQLAARGVGASAAVYVGNDVLNDVAPARQVGFRTVLFAGDARSLRLREGDPRTTGAVPDAVVTDLADLPGCIARG